MEYESVGALYILIIIVISHLPCPHQASATLHSAVFGSDCPGVSIYSFRNMKHWCRPCCESE